jgi:predicted RNA-binding Zn ribbon-like protein
VARAQAVQSSDWKDGFLFVGNQPALDFVNTCPVQDGKPVELLPDFGALLRWLQAAELVSSQDAAKLHKEWGQSARALHTVEAVRELRERLRKEIVVWENGGAIHQSTVAELNRRMRNYPMVTRLKVKGRASSTELWFEPKQPEDLFAPLAHGAAMLFSKEDPARVRKCGHCILHFLDTSKKGSRRWCSMQLCGNRLKVAAYAARKRKVDSTE